MVFFLCLFLSCCIENRGNSSLPDVVQSFDFVFDKHLIGVGVSRA